MRPNKMFPHQFGWGSYLGVLSKIMKDPRVFFSENASETSWIRPATVLLMSSTFFALASAVMGMPDSTWLMALILFVNAVGMVFITSGLGYMVSILSRKSVMSYQKIFGIYAYASGAILVIAWMPFMLWISEIWRWWLIGVGLVNGGGLNKRDSFFIISLSLLMLITFFWTLFPLVRP